MSTYNKKLKLVVK